MDDDLEFDDEMEDEEVDEGNDLDVLNQMLRNRSMEFPFESDEDFDDQ